MAEDYSKPRNLKDSFFDDLNLPEQSNIQRTGKQLTGAQAKYEDQADNDFFQLNLAAESHFIGKNQDQTRTSQNSNKQQETAQVEPIKKSSLRGTASRIQKKNNNKKKQSQTKKPQIDLDRQIGEVAEWADRKAQDNSDQQDFEEAKQVGQTKQQEQIRKRLDEKLKNGFNQNAGGGGLKAKAEQIRRQKQNKQKQQNLIREQKQKQNKQIIKSSKQVDQDDSALALKPTKQAVEQKKQPPKQSTQQALKDDDEDDPWDKVNKQTINKYTNLQQKRKDMNLKSVLKFYQEEFQFDEAEIDDDMIGKNKLQETDQEEEMGCLEAFFSCFKQSQPKQNKKYNFTLAKRLVAISQNQLGNGDQEFWLLKQIWDKLTGKAFSRYGSHWNQVGFQGRDPVTDLRVTGVLSLLQWVQFIEIHEQLSEKYYSWSLQHDYPLALTHIKLTGIFLELLSKGKIRQSNWDEFQMSYNCLVIGIFKKMMNDLKIGDILGSLVEDTVRQMKKQYPELLKSYKSEYGKSKNKA